MNENSRPLLKVTARMLRPIVYKKINDVSTLHFKRYYLFCFFCDVASCSKSVNVSSVNAITIM